MIRLIIPDLHFSTIRKDVQSILKSGMLTQGAYVKKFEKRLAQIVRARYAFSTTSATSALHLSLAALGIGPGDEVLVTDFTFPATANVVVQLGATPVLVDINPHDYTIDLADLKKKITKKTKAIIPVDTFGYPAPMNDIVRIARRHSIPVIEDAACAIGARIGKKRCGSFPTVGCFSFHPRKTITTGEGGMVTTNDPSLAQKIGILRNHGGVYKESKGYYEYVAAGYNYRMSEIQAALGLRQLPDLQKIITQRRRKAQRYSQLLRQHSDITAPVEENPRFHTYQSYVVQLAPHINRNSVIKAMRTQGIETTLGTYALHAQPFFQKQFGYHKGDLPNSLAAFNQTLTLPLHDKLTDQQQRHIIKTLVKIIS